MDKILEKIILKARDDKVSDEETLLILIKDSLRGQNFSAFPSNIILRKTYRAMVKEGKIGTDKGLEKLLVTKRMRSLSGVAVITVLTKPWPCPGECLYCPTQKDVPKSYLSSEPAVMRAILCDYDPYRQVEARLNSLELEGHPTDKVELIVIGGTFSALPKDYQEEYITQCFRALNDQFPIPNSQSMLNDQISKKLSPIVIPAEAGIPSNINENKNIKGFLRVRSDGHRRVGRNDSLEVAKKENETAKHRCVGLTLETRPDHITEKEVEHMRYLGATRVELGVQSVFDDVLRFNKRGHDIQSTINATKLLKDAGLKICYHMMPNLPNSNLEKDLEMFKIIFTDPRFQPDYIKIYPCMVTKGSKLYDLWKTGKYQPYSDIELENLIYEIKKTVPYYVRIMRLIRDIPSSDIEAGSKISNMRQNVQKKLEKDGERCKCIRCREISDKAVATKIKLFREEYEASGGKEIFLSYESVDRSILYSLLRLRITKDAFLPEIKGCTLIRELHTYGQQIKIGKKGKTQHKGLGKKLILEAEKIAKEKGFKKIVVIAGVGVRDYYRKFGYELVSEYMVKEL